MAWNVVMPTDQDKQGLMCHEHSPDRNHQFQSAACARAAQLWAHKSKHVLHCFVHFKRNHQCSHNPVFNSFGWRSNRRRLYARWPAVNNYSDTNIWGYRRHGCVLVVSEYSVESGFIYSSRCSDLQCKSK